MTKNLPLGDISPGDIVYVRRSPNDSRGRTPDDLYVPATITSIARVWVEIASAGGRQTWRMRRDTQSENSQFMGSNAEFLTVDQYEREIRFVDAQRFLRAQGLADAIRPFADTGVRS